MMIDTDATIATIIRTIATIAIIETPMFTLADAR